MGWFKNLFRKWLGITPPANDNYDSFNLDLRSNFEVNYMKNKLWYIGSPELLSQFFKKLNKKDGVSAGRFWSIAPTDDNSIRKVHFDIIKLAIDKLSEIVLTDLDEISVTADNQPVEIFGDDGVFNQKVFYDLLKEFLIKILACGDVCFKFNFNGKTKECGIELIDGDRVEYNYFNGRIVEICFFTEYKKNEDKYILKEFYRENQIDYKLFLKDKEVALSELEETRELLKVEFKTDKRMILALPVFYKKSLLYEGRGEGVIEGKTDALDMLDETMSQWIDSYRDGRTNSFIPPDFLPHNQMEQPILNKNPLKTRYVVGYGSDKQGYIPKIEQTQSDIRSSEYLSGYATALDAALMGIVSPSTLGIDLKKLDNGEAQREKEKTTQYSRDRLIAIIQNDITELIALFLKFNDIMVKERAPLDYDVLITFGEYASPSFNDIVETLAKGAPGKQLFSFEFIAKELFSKNKDVTPEELAAEVLRLKALNMPPAASNYITEFDITGAAGEPEKEVINADTGEPEPERSG